MKQQIPIWVALTFLMLFLVVVAGFVFTLQTRGQLVANASTLESELASVQSQAETTEAKATGSALALADAEATRDGLSAEMNQLQVQPDLAQTTEPDEVEQVVTPQVVEESMAPEVSLVNPTEGASVLPGEPLEILVSVADSVGVSKVTLLVDDVVLEDISADDQVLFTVKESWSSEETGRFKIGVSATNKNGLTSERIEATITVGDRESALREQVAEIQAQVESLRGLEANGPISLTLYTKAELRENFEELFADDVSEEEARRNVIELYAFDFIDLDYPLYDNLLDLYSESVLGFYDPEDKTLVVVSDDGLLSPAEQLTLAHEIVHALQDQAFGLDFDDEDSEASMARRSLAEGDATLIQKFYIEAGYFDSAEIELLLQELTEASDSDQSDLPPVILEQQIFPYEQGAEFAQSVYDTGGGLAGLDAAWDNPPISTEQIIHPELYQADDIPQIIELPAYTTTVGTDWQFITENTLGEFSISLYLEQQVDQGQSELAAAGWGGDRYAVYWNAETEEVVMVMLGVWDTSDDELEFSRAMVEYASQKYAVSSTPQADGSRCWIGEADVICLYQVNGTTLVIRAPDTDMVGKIRFATRIP